MISVTETPTRKKKGFVKSFYRKKRTCKEATFSESELETFVLRMYKKTNRLPNTVPGKYDVCTVTRYFTIMIYEKVLIRCKNKACDAGHKVIIRHAH